MIIWPEAEVTSDSSTFPIPESRYWASFQWQRFYLGTGHMYFTSQLSTYDWWMGEWNSRHHDLLFNQPYDRGHLTSTIKTDNTSMQENFNNQPITILGYQDRLYNYKVQTDNYNEMEVEIDFNIKTIKDLKDYLQQNQNIINEINQQIEIEKIPIVVTFNNPISQIELTRLQDKYLLNLESFEARVTNQFGERITIGGIPDKNNETNVESVYNSILSPTKFLGERFRLVGVTSIEGTVVSVNLNSLSRDPAIFIVDALPAWLIIKNNVLKNLFKNELKLIDINLNDLFWYKEDLLTG